MFNKDNSRSLDSTKNKTDNIIVKNKSTSQVRKVGEHIVLSSAYTSGSNIVNLYPTLKVKVDKNNYTCKSQEP